LTCANTGVRKANGSTSAEAQTAAMVKMEAALDALANVIKNLPGAGRRTDQ